MPKSPDSRFGRNLCEGLLSPVTSPPFIGALSFGYRDVRPQKQTKLGIWPKVDSLDEDSSATLRP
jgi:hypothetical protein